MSHTPGPWQAIKFKGEWMVQAPGLHDKHWWVMANSRSEADAHLIAAAPDLLEALQQTSDCLAEAYARYSTKIGPFASQCQRVNGIARAAIAKAISAAKRESA